MADNLHLLGLAKNGDTEARNSLVRENMGLVISVAKRYAGRGQELEDLIQLGLIGLLKAIDRFDMDFEVQLSTYAVPLIQGEIRRFLRDDGMIKVGRNLKAVNYKAERYRQDMIKKQGIEPGIEDICEHVGVSPEELIMAMEASVEVADIDDITERAVGQNESDAAVDRLFISELLGMLSEYERRLIMLRYFENKTQGQIGSLLGISQVQVSRLEKKILAKLRNQRIDTDYN